MKNRLYIEKSRSLYLLGYVFGAGITREEEYKESWDYSYPYAENYDEEQIRIHKSIQPICFSFFNQNIQYSTYFCTLGGFN